MSAQDIAASINALPPGDRSGDLRVYGEWHSGGLHDARRDIVSAQADGDALHLDLGTGTLVVEEPGDFERDDRGLRIGRAAAVRGMDHYDHSVTGSVLYHPNGFRTDGGESPFELVYHRVEPSSAGKRLLAAPYNSPLQADEGRQRSSVGLAVLFTVLVITAVLLALSG